jgi:hypothetical protein
VAGDDTIERNASTLEALRALAASLSDDDLERPLGGGWVVATAFAHLAFWDRRQALALRHFVESGAFIEEDETVNPSLEPLLFALPPRTALELALGAGELVNATVAGLDAAARSTVEASEHAYLARRWAHREEHMAQIEAGLGR